MINAKLFKISRRATIVLLIAIFGVFGFISCMNGEDVLGSRSTTSSVAPSGGIGDSGNNQPPAEEPTKETFPYNTIFSIRVPFGVGGIGYTNVSYKDTNTLKQLWFDQINRKAVNDGKVFAIRNRANNRNSDNFQKKHTHGQYSAQDYYYFNENGDIVYKEDNVTIKKFMGAIITEYRDVTIERGNVSQMGFNNNKRAIKNISWQQRGVYTVGAIYANALTTEEARTKYMGSENPFKDGVYNFVTYWHEVQTWHIGLNYQNNIFERQYINPGFIEVLVMYDYYDKKEEGEAAVHSYYPYYGIYNYYKEYSGHPGVYFTDENMPYMTNHNIYLGQSPEFTTKQLTHTAAFTDNHRGWRFMFVPGHKN